MARDELPAAVASITAVLQTLPAAEHAPTDEASDAMAPDQHVKLAYEAQDNTQYDTMDDLQIEAQLRSQVNQGCGEATPDTYSDHYMISPITEEEHQFQAPVQRICQTSTAPPIGKRQESFLPG